MKKARFPIFATVLTIAAIAVLCGLGKWQLDRLAWKTGIIQKLEAEYEKDAAIIFLRPIDLAGNFDYKRGTLHGVYDYSKQIKLGPRVYGNIPGFQVLTPLRLEDGSYILVNRGWVPQDWLFANEIVKGPGETIAVTGLVKQPDQGNPFTPENIPEKDLWYHPDIAQIGRVQGLAPLHIHMLYREGMETGEYPVPQAAKPDIVNNHMEYAIFWFLMAGILAVIYALRFLRKQKPHG